MKKQRIVIETYCDLCKTAFASLKCKICDKDICNNCARYLCKYNPPPISPSSSQFGMSSESYSFRQTYEPVAKETICIDCCEAFKMTIAVAAGQDKVDKKKVEKEIQDKPIPKKEPTPTSMYS